MEHKQFIVDRSQKNHGFCRYSVSHRQRTLFSQLQPPSTSTRRSKLGREIQTKSPHSDVDFLLFQHDMMMIKKDVPLSLSRRKGELQTIRFQLSKVGGVGPESGGQPMAAGLDKPQSHQLHRRINETRPKHIHVQFRVCSSAFPGTFCWITKRIQWTFIL